MTRRSNGEGSVYRRKDGVWVGAVTTPQGRRYRYGKSRSAVVAKLNDITGVGGPAVATGALLLMWLDAVKPGLRPSTVVSYEGHIRMHLAPLAGIRADRLRPEDIEDLQSRLRSEGLAPRTVAYTNTILRMAFKWAGARGLVVRNPAALVRPPRHKTSTMTPLTPDQVRALLDATTDPVRRGLYAVMVGCGLRLGEALGLRWANIDADILTVEYALRPVPGQPRGKRLQLVEPKTARSRRSLTMPAFVRSAIEAVPRRAELVFTTPVGTPVDPRNIARQFKADLAAAGLPAIRLHDLRHTAATIMLANGVDLATVRDILGHTSIATTAIYTHVVPAMKADAAARMDATVGEP